MRVGVLTSGGDTSALNATIYGIASAGEERGWEVIGIRRGYQGLLGYTDESEDFAGVEMVRLTGPDLEGIQYTGGSILKSSRANPSSPERVTKIDRVMERYGLDAIIPIGGDDTNRGALVLHNAGIDLNTVNKTMDNDMMGTLFCLGYPSAAHYATSYAGGMHSTLKTNDRDLVLYVFGREAGWAPLATASWLDPRNPTAYPHLVLIPEMGGISMEEILELYGDAKSKHGYAVLAVSEGVRIEGIQDDVDELVKKYGAQVIDEHGNLDFKALDLPGYIAEEIRDYRGLRTPSDREKRVMYRRLDYFLRSGPPIRVDRELGIAAGKRVIELLEEGVRGKMVNIVRGDIVNNFGVGEIPLEEVSGGRTVEDHMFDPVSCTPKEGFIEYTKPFIQDPTYYRLFNAPLPGI